MGQLPVDIQHSHQAQAEPDPAFMPRLESERHWGAKSACLLGLPLLLPLQVYEVIGTSVAKTLSGSLEHILKSKSNKAAAAIASEKGATERCLQSFVGVLCALCPCPSGDSRDTSSTSEAGRRLGDVCIVALPVLCPGLRRFQKVGWRCLILRIFGYMHFLLLWH